MLLQQNFSFEETNLRLGKIKEHYYTCADYYSYQELHILEAFTYFSFYRPKIEFQSGDYPAELSKRGTLLLNKSDFSVISDNKLLLSSKMRSYSSSQISTNEYTGIPNNHDDELIIESPKV